MPWRETARDEYRRESGRYASDMTDREWALIEPFMPPVRCHRRPRTTDLREVVNAVLYIAMSGRPRRRYPGSRRGAGGARVHPPCLPLATSRLRRQCPWWAEAARCPRTFRGLDDRNRQARLGSISPTSSSHLAASHDIVFLKRLSRQAVILVSIPCIEYVIVHELAHAVEPDHGARWQRLMDMAMPDWRDRKKRLETGLL